MTVLTKISVSKAEALKHRLIDAYAWHKDLWSSFPDRPEANRDFLFRIDDRSSSFDILMLSSISPEPGPWGHWQSKVITSRFLEHQNYRFQLKANPTMRRNSDGRRLGLYKEELLLAWVKRKAESNGFIIHANTLEIGDPIDQTFYRKNKQGKHVSVDFKGVLTVQDKTSFQKAFHCGIGSAKSFGFGMLMLQPVSI